MLQQSSQRADLARQKFLPLHERNAAAMKAEAGSRFMAGRDVVVPGSGIGGVDRGRGGADLTAEADASITLWPLKM